MVRFLRHLKLSSEVIELVPEGRLEKGNAAALINKISARSHMAVRASCRKAFGSDWHTCNFLPQNWPSAAADAPFLPVFPSPFPRANALLSLDQMGRENQL